MSKKRTKGTTKPTTPKRTEAVSVVNADAVDTSGAGTKPRTKNKPKPDVASRGKTKSKAGAVAAEPASLAASHTDDTSASLAPEAQAQKGTARSKAAAKEAQKAAKKAENSKAKAPSAKAQPATKTKGKTSETTTNHPPRSSKGANPTSDKTSTRRSTPQTPESDTDEPLSFANSPFADSPFAEHADAEGERGETNEEAEVARASRAKTPAGRKRESKAESKAKKTSASHESQAEDADTKATQKEGRKPKSGRSKSSSSANPLVEGEPTTREPVAEADVSANTEPAEDAPIAAPDETLIEPAALPPEGEPSGDEEDSEEPSLFATEPATDDEDGEVLSEEEENRRYLKGILEALLFSSDKPLSGRELARAARIDKKRTLQLLLELRKEYKHRGVNIAEISGGFVLRSNPTYGAYVQKALALRPVRLSRAQLETLAIIAYRQPITRPEIDDIRGVDSGQVLKGLADRDLIKMVGKKDEAGRPMLYGTTDAFLELFSLESLKGLPSLREFTELSDDSKEKFAAATGETIPTGDNAGDEPAELGTETSETSVGDDLSEAPTEESAGSADDTAGDKASEDAADDWHEEPVDDSEDAGDHTTVDHTVDEAGAPQEQDAEVRASSTNNEEQELELYASEPVQETSDEDYESLSAAVEESSDVTDEAEPDDDDSNAF